MYTTNLLCESQRSYLTKSQVSYFTKSQRSYLTKSQRNYLTEPLFNQNPRQQPLYCASIDMSLIKTIQFALKIMFCILLEDSFKHNKSKIVSYFSLILQRNKILTFISVVFAHGDQNSPWKFQVRRQPSWTVTSDLILFRALSQPDSKYTKLGQYRKSKSVYSNMPDIVSNIGFRGPRQRQSPLDIYPGTH